MEYSWSQYSYSNSGSISYSYHHGVVGFFNSRCLRCYRCCASNRIISVVPAVFLYVFSVYLYVNTFELYAFNRIGWKDLRDVTNNSNDSARVCVTARELNTRGRHGNSTTNRVQSDVALLNLFVGVANQIPGILSAIVLGHFSDRYGRKTAMGVVTVGLVLQSLLANLIFEFNLDLKYFILSSGLRALTGGLAGLLTTSYSYIADISSKKWLTLQLGILEAVTFIASSLGIAISCTWIQLTNCQFTPVSWLMLASSVALILYVVFFVRESLTRRQTMQRRLLLATGLKSLLVGFKIFFSRSRGVPLWKLWLSMAVLCIAVINQVGTFTIVTLFLLHEPLEWSPGIIGAYLAGNELIRGLSLIIILPIMVTCSLRDASIALGGVTIACLTNIGMGFVTKTWQMFVAGSIQGVDAVITPTVKAIMSKLVPPQEQGALFSLISAVQVLSGAAAFVLYSLAYKTSLGIDWSRAGAGSSFWLMAILYAIAIPLLSLLRFCRQTPEHFVNSECTPSSPSPSTPGIITQPSSPTKILSPPPPPLSNHDHDGLTDEVSSVQWALSKTEAQRRLLTPASVGHDALERQSLLGRSYASSFGYHSTVGSIN